MIRVYLGAGIAAAAAAALAGAYWAGWSANADAVRAQAHEDFAATIERLQNEDVDLSDDTAIRRRLGDLAGASPTALCSGTEASRKAHAGALVADGGPKSRVTGVTLLGQLQRGCDA